jgi:hypothetical protein
MFVGKQPRKALGGVVIGWVDKFWRKDKPADRYIERVVTEEGEVLKDVDEPLSAHRGHGSDKPELKAERLKGEEMSETILSVTKLDQYMAVIGQVMARFVSEGLLRQPIDTFAPEAFLGTPVDPKTFEAVITWMLDEGIIRGKERIQTIEGRLRIIAVPLHSEGLAMVQQPLPAGKYSKAHSV